LRLRRSVLIPCIALVACLTACTPAQKAWFRQYVANYSIPTSVEPVMQCIKDHESGNYDEHSHPDGSTGAYQFEGSTWRTWFGRWRDAVEFRGSDYYLAYEAPPLIQDAVTAYTLTHGGAHNWDPAYGNDPCTVGLP